MIDHFKKYSILLVAGIILFMIMAPAVHSKEFIQPVSEFSTNYYDAYGEPDIYGSIVGDVEYERGEEYLISVVLSNRGVLHGVKYSTSVGTSEVSHSISLKELEYEAYRTTAIGVKAELISTSDLIEIDPSMDLQTLDSLMPGVLPDSPLYYKLKVSKYAPAGEYLLMLPIDYQFQSEVEMTGGSTSLIGLPDLDHTTLYEKANKTLILPVYVKPAPRFEIVDVEGELVAGSSSIINVTYKNAGELPANDVIARIVTMKPLSSPKNELTLGTLEPGDMRTVSFEMAAASDAIVKDHALSGEVKYIDENGETSLSDPLVIKIPLKEPEATLPMKLLLNGSIALVILYMVARYVRKIN